MNHFRTFNMPEKHTNTEVIHELAGYVHHAYNWFMNDTLPHTLPNI